MILLVLSLIVGEIGVAYRFLPKNEAIMISMLVGTIGLCFYVIHSKICSLIIPSKEVEGAKISSQIAGLRKQFDKSLKGAISLQDSAPVKSFDDGKINNKLLEETNTIMLQKLKELNHENEKNMITIQQKMDKQSKEIQSKFYELLPLLVDVRNAITTEGLKAHSRTKILQESIFTTALINRAKVCVAELYIYKQLRFCLEALVTPVELQMLSQNEFFTPVTYDKEKAEMLMELNEKLTCLNTGDISNLSTSELKSAILSLLGIEAMIFDEDATGICCGRGQCEGECKDKLVECLINPLNQMVRSNIPGTLQELRRHEVTRIHEREN